MRKILFLLLFLTGCGSLHPADAIIVLGGGIREDGSMQPMTQARLEKGIDLFLDENAPLMVVSGRWTYFSDKQYLITEADAMYEYAINNGVAFDQILKEPQSQDTFSSALNTYTLLSERNITSVIVVTSDFHTFRADYLFSKVFDDVQIVTVPSGADVWDTINQYLKEGIGIAATVLLFPPGTGPERMETFQHCCNPGEF
jgi:uncharacterized SAM-binding protein YcdF (DUF218 family)